MRMLLPAAVLALVIGCGKKNPDPPPDGGGGSPPPVGVDPLPVSAPDDKAEAVKRLKQIGLAMHNFEGTFGWFPAGIVTKGDAVGLSWRVQILPFVEQDTLYKQFKLDEPWDSEHNKKLLDKMPEVFASPGSKAPAGHTHLRCFIGMYGLVNTPPPGIKGPALPPPTASGTPVRGRQTSGFTDGTSNTFVVVEAADAVPWTKPEELSANPPPKGPFTPDAVVLPKLGVYPGGFHAVMADGKVVFFPDTVSPASIRAMMTPAHGEILGTDAAVVLYPPKPKAATPPSVAPDAPRQAAVENLHAIVRAAHDYFNMMGTLPAGIVGPNRQMGLSWRVELLPLLGEKALYSQFKLDEAWDGPTNKPLLEKMPKVFASLGKPAPAGMTFLRTTQGPSGLLRTPLANPQPGKMYRGPVINSILDGTSNTALVVEAADAVPWTKPDELPLAGSVFDKREPAVPKLGGAFDGGFHAGMADGMVVFVKGTLPPRDVFALLTPAGGEVSSLDGHVAYAVPPPPAPPKPQGKTLTKP